MPKTVSLALDASEYDPQSMTVEQARSVIRRYLTPVDGTVRLPLGSTLGRILAEDILSPVNVPPHANSAMDGYAVRFSDLDPNADTPLNVGETILAGTAPVHSLAQRQAMRIMTGSMIPPGADTVIMQEHTRRSGDTVWVEPGQLAGQHIRPIGEDLRKGAPALPRGRLMRAAELGLVASLGIPEIMVYRPLRVAFFSTGDELASIGQPLADGRIYDSNRYSLRGMLGSLGCDCLDLGVVRDDPVALENAFEEAASEADVIISTGGVSVGEADFIKPLLARMGEVLFWKIAMRPGRPFAFGRLRNRHFFGLPGNPVAVMVTFYAIVKESLQVLSGLTPLPVLPRFRVCTTTALKKAPGRTEFQRGILSAGPHGEWTVRSTGNQGSGVLSSMSAANCFIVLPREAGPVPAGAEVEVQLFEGLL